MTKKKKGKQEVAQNIAVSIRKPTRSASNKLEQALDFAQGHGLEVPPSTDQRNLSEQKETEAGRVLIHAWTLMPQDEKAKKILQQRAKIFAQTDAQHNEEVVEQYIRFRLGLTQQYGIPYKFAEKILSAAKVTRVPCTPPVIAGIVNYCGELLTVFDLKKVFRSGQGKNIEKPWIIIVGEGKAKAGLIVDEIEDNDEFVPARLAPPLGDNKYIQGVHAGRVVILNIGSILTDSSLQIDESMN